MKTKLMLLTIVIAVSLSGCRAKPESLRAIVPDLKTAGLKVLAGRGNIQLFEYEGDGVRCLIASSGSDVDMVCQNLPASTPPPVEDGPKTPPSPVLPSAGAGILTTLFGLVVQ